MDRTNTDDYQRLYSTELKQIDKNLDHFIKRKEEALERRLAETKNRE